jgi:nicotinate-nucleotide pyrophosphorylase
LSAFQQLFAAGAIGGQPLRASLSDCRILFDAHHMRAALVDIIAGIDEALSSWQELTVQALSKIEQDRLLAIAVSCIRTVAVLPEKKERLIVPGGQG